MEFIVGALDPDELVVLTALVEESRMDEAAACGHGDYIATAGFALPGRVSHVGIAPTFGLATVRGRHRGDVPISSVPCFDRISLSDN
jgi:hypothetical protein